MFFSGFEIFMEDSLHFEEALCFEQKNTDFISELEDPDSSEKPSRQFKFCLGKETEQCDEVSISKVLLAEHILPTLTFENIFQNDTEQKKSKPVKTVKKVHKPPKKSNVWIGGRKRRRRRVQSQQPAIRKSENTVTPEAVVLPMNEHNASNAEISESIQSQNKELTAIEMTVDHTYSKMCPNTLSKTIKPKLGRPVGSRTKRHLGKDTNDQSRRSGSLNQSRRSGRLKSAQESLQSQMGSVAKDNESSAKLDDSLKSADCHETTQFEGNTSQLLEMRKDLFPGRVENEMSSDSPNVESLTNLDANLETLGDAQEFIQPDQNIPKPLLMRKDLFLERDKSHSDTELYQKLKDKCPIVKPNASHTSTWNKSKQSRKRTKQITVPRRKSSRVPTHSQDKSTCCQNSEPEKTNRADDDDLNIVITKVVSFNPSVASKFIKSEIKQEPSCSSTTDSDVEYMTWTIPAEWTQGLIDVKSEEDADATGVKSKTAQKSNKKRLTFKKQDPLKSKGVFHCLDCGKKYRYRRGLLQHQRLECMKEPQFACPYCPRKYRYPQCLRDHVNESHKKAYSYWYSMHYSQMIRRKGIDY